MPVQSTSINTYHDTKSERSQRCEDLYDLYAKKGFMSDREAGQILGWYPSDVSARRNDLGMRVMQKGTKKDSVTHRTVMTWGLSDTLF